MNDLIFHGGLQGVVFGNQQFTVRYVSVDTGFEVRHTHLHIAI